MPVDGLPPALECVLTTLITNSPLTSFKIDGRGDNTVVVLRFSSEHQNNNMATQRYRIKPPSQIARDRRRAQQRTAEQVGAVSTSPTPLFLPTPPTKMTENNSCGINEPNNIADPIGLLHVNKAGRTFQRDVGPDSARAAHEADLGLPFIQDSECVVVSTNQLIDTIVQAPDSESEGETKSDYSEDMPAEPPPGTTEYIGSIRDKSILQRLKDRRRNLAFRKIVLNTIHPDHLLLCDSDDIVVMFNCVTRRVHHWFVKQPDNKLIDVERTCLDRLKRWEPPDTDLGEDDVSEATKQLHFLRTVIRSLLT